MTLKQHQKNTMTIKRLSKKTQEKPSSKTKNEKITDSFISSGGKTTEESEKNLESNDLDFRFTLRIPRKIIQKIDVLRNQKVGKFSRNTWILQAICEKIKSK